MRVILVAVGVAVAAVLVAVAGPPVKNHNLEVELIRMERDARPAAFPTSGPFQLGAIRRFAPNPNGVAPEVESQRLGEIIDNYGWPTKSLVGAEASHDAWLVASRVSDPAFLGKAYAAMSKHKSDIVVEDFAVFTDRVAVANGQPQTYGTAFRCDNGNLVEATPLKDPANVGALRRAAHLPPYRAIDVRGGGPCGDPYTKTIHIGPGTGGPPLPPNTGPATTNTP